MKESSPVTVIVRRQIHPNDQVPFEAAMNEFVAFALASSGHLDIQVIRSGDGHYTVVDRFRDGVSRNAFVNSVDYQRHQAVLRGLSLDTPDILESHGLAGWFAGPRAPNPIKLGLVTFLGVLPLTSTLPLLIGRMTPNAPFLVNNFIVTVFVVTLLAWPVMPMLTRLFEPWLARKEFTS